MEMYEVDQIINSDGPTLQFRDEKYDVMHLKDDVITFMSQKRAIAYGIVDNCVIYNYTHIVAL
ncbi:unnamed protein product [Clavelina lepadiformis]|uniref:Uncharacterized protein n=1 Tax=Clavelina lepadiformis TaxID=159417 RepID=A0ABP0GJX2_CLALP